MTITTSLQSQADELKLPPIGSSTLSPAAVGWGNVLVPGLGATLRGHAFQGLLEASIELGTFYGGLFGIRESHFTIDGNVRDPETQTEFNHAVTGQILQQAGLKYHFWNTFYHYQQASIERENQEGPDSNPQALWRGKWTDTIRAPFDMNNLSNPWAFSAIIVGSALLVLDYATSEISPIQVRLSSPSEQYYAFNQIAVTPVGSSFGEDPFFHGFVQREIRGATQSSWMAAIGPAIPYSLLHEDRLNAFIVGLYYGIATNCLHGNLGPIMASHFWVNVVDGILSIWSLERAQRRDAPFNPPVAAKFQFMF